LKRSRWSKGIINDKADTGYKIATWAQTIRPSIMQKMLESLNNPKMISFALGLPDSELFPISEYRKSINRILPASYKMLNYAPPIASLKQQIVKLMAIRKVKCGESQIFLTSGAQQAIAILARLLLNQGSTIATESLTYPGLLQIVAPFCPEIIGVPIDCTFGLCLETLERVLNNTKNKPAFFYSIPEGHNPLGVSLTDNQKKKIAALSRHYQIPIIEDDAYGFLNYDSSSIPIRSYEDQWVFYVGTFSKILAPSFRVGWIIVPEELIPKLAYIKEGLDINTATFGQRIVDEFLKTGIFPEYMDSIRDTYKQRRDTMLKVIKNYFPKDCKINIPASGFFVWVELQRNLNTTTLFHKCIAKNVAFMPSEAFSCNAKHVILNGMRLNFSSCSQEAIESGVKLLGEIIIEELAIKNHKQNNYLELKNM